MNKAEEYFDRGNEKADAVGNKGTMEDNKNLIREFFLKSGA